MIFYEGKPKLFSFDNVAIGEIHPELRLPEVFLDDHRFDDVEGNYD